MDANKSSDLSEVGYEDAKNKHLNDVCDVGESPNEAVDRDHDFKLGSLSYYAGKDGVLSKNEFMTLNESSIAINGALPENEVETSIDSSIKAQDWKPIATKILRIFEEKINIKGTHTPVVPRSIHRISVSNEPTNL